MASFAGGRTAAVFKMPRSCCLGNEPLGSARKPHIQGRTASWMAGGGWLVHSELDPCSGGYTPLAKE